MAGEGKGKKMKFPQNEIKPNSTKLFRKKKLRKKEENDEKTY